MNLLVSTEFIKWLWVVTGNRYYIQCDGLVEVGVFVKDGALLGLGWEELYVLKGGDEKRVGKQIFLKKEVKGCTRTATLLPPPHHA